MVPCVEKQLLPPSAGSDLAQDPLGCLPRNQNAQEDAADRPRVFSTLGQILTMRRLWTFSIRDRLYILWFHLHLLKKIKYIWTLPWDLDCWCPQQLEHTVAVRRSFRNVQSPALSLSLSLVKSWTVTSSDSMAVRGLHFISTLSYLIIKLFKQSPKIHGKVCQVTVTTTLEK